MVTSEIRFLERWKEHGKKLWQIQMVRQIKTGFRAAVVARNTISFFAPGGGVATI